MMCGKIKYTVKAEISIEIKISHPYTVSLDELLSRQTSAHAPTPNGTALWHPMGNVR
jgi:hypothetical protein